MKKILLLFLSLICFNDLIGQTTIVSYFGMSDEEIEKHFNDSTFKSIRLVDNNRMEVFSTAEGQAIKFFFNENKKCNAILYATNMHEVAKNIIDDNDMECGPSRFKNNALRWECSNKYLISLSFYTNIGYPYQFTYVLLNN